MVRKGIIMILTALAVATLVAYIESYVAKPKAGQCWAHVWVLNGNVVDFGPTFTVSTSRGTLGLQYSRVGSPINLLASKDLSFPGFKRRTTLRGLGIINYYVSLWIPFVLFATYPTIAFIRGPVRRWRRRRRNECVHCGYVLKGLPEPKCPECGSEV
jgi:hypothetical protein